MQQNLKKGLIDETVELGKLKLLGISLTTLVSKKTGKFAYSGFLTKHGEVVHCTTLLEAATMVPLSYIFYLTVARNIPNYFNFKEAKWYDLLGLFALFTWDDWGTAVGFQSSDPWIKVTPKMKEKFEEMGIPPDTEWLPSSEGNGTLNVIISGLVERGWAANETQALMRFTTLSHLMLFLWWYKWGFTGPGKMVMYGLGIAKAAAGNGWHSFENEFNYLQGPMFLFGDLGKKTPYMVDITLDHPHFKGSTS